MSRARKGEYILFKTDAKGPDLETVAERVRTAEGVELLHKSASAILVTGRSGAVKSFAADLDGWHSEPNGKVRSVS